MNSLAKPTCKVKPRVIVDADGIIWPRTKLLTFAVANNFAKCQRANKRFECAIVVQSRAANPPKNFYVKYLPANPQRQLALAGNEEQKRINRAKSAEFQFFTDPDNASLVFCLSDSGEVHEIRNGICNCPDKRYRAGKMGIHCKHEFKFLSQPVAETESPEEKHARILRDRLLDYPEDHELQYGRAH